MLDWSFWFIPPIRSLLPAWYCNSRDVQPNSGIVIVVLAGLSIAFVSAAQTGMGIFLSIPWASFCIGAVMAGSVRRMHLVVGFLSAPWFLVFATLRSLPYSSPVPRWMSISDSAGPTLALLLIPGALGGVAAWIVARTYRKDRPE